MFTTHAVGIDLGTTYSCIAYLNEQGEPVSIPNQEGEISTPSVVLYDKGDEIVGTEALRNTIMNPAHVVQNAKRWMGDPEKKWTVDGIIYTPIDISTAILKKLLGDAQKQIGQIERAVITVPAQFSERQRLATVKAGQNAGLKQVDIINEPVAAALCYVLGTEGLWFSELAAEQRILVYDLGGGTFDLSLVSYQKDHVKVIASTGDLHLGGIDFNQCLVTAIAEQFTREFGDDPRRDPESLQHLAWEVEQCKRSLTVRPKAALIVQHGGRRKTYQIERGQFNQLTQHLVKRTEEITRGLIDKYRKGASHLDLTVLSAGGSSRMPMIDEMLHTLKGTTVSKALSPDQSIAHGATYYAGMLLTNSEFVHSIIDPGAVARLSKMRQQSVNARDLGILIRDMKSGQRIPYYLIAADTPLPTEVTKVFGTVVPNQKRVNLFIVESGAGTDQQYSELGTCTIHELPPNLPAESKIAVTISYDSSARVQVSARDVTSGREARTEIQRGENLVMRAADQDEESVTLEPPEGFAIAGGGQGGTGSAGSSRVGTGSAGGGLTRSGIRLADPVPDMKPLGAPGPASAKSGAAGSPGAKRPAAASPGSAEVPIMLCETCGEILNSRGDCPVCKSKAVVTPQRATGSASGAKAPPRPAAAQPQKPPAVKAPPPVRAAGPGSAAPPKPQPARPQAPTVKPAPSGIAPVPLPRKPDSSEIIELPRKKPAAPPAKRPARPGKSGPTDPGEEEFWKIINQ
jgi:molecular chaperone DnaK